MTALFSGKVIEPKPIADAVDATETPAPAAFRAILIMERVARAEHPLTVTELATSTGLAKSSVANLLTTLEAAGIMRRTDKRWSLTFKALEIGQSVLSSTDLVKEFRDEVSRRPTLSRETTLLAVLDGLDVLYIARNDGAQPVRLASDIGKRLPAVVTGLGKAMLSTLPDDELRERLGSITTLPRPTRRAHRTIDALMDDLKRTRERGWAHDDEQNTIGVSCFAVPVPGADQPTAISTTLPTQRLTPSLMHTLVSELGDTARALGRVMAY